MPLSFFSSLRVPDGAIATMQFIIDHTFGKKKVCPMSIGAIASLRGKSRQTISLHLAFWEDLKQVRLERPKRGDSRCTRIVLVFRERREDVKTVADLLIADLPEKVVSGWTFSDFKAERRKNKAGSAKGKEVA